MICPRCSVAEISPLTNRCELCGYAPDGGGIAIEASIAEGVDEPAHREMGHLFHFDAILGVSAHSAVYLARTLEASQHLILKVVRRPAEHRPDLEDRFHRAAETAAALEHPHLLPVTGHGVTQSLYWYTMEHQRSHSLRLMLATRGPLDVRSTQRLVAQIGSALDYGHRRGVIHGSLKPENVLIDPDGWVHVCDALIARCCELPVVPGLAGARPPHIAPEDWTEGAQAAAADQWALGVLVHECLTGMVPAEATEVPQSPAAPLDGPRPDIPIHIAQAVRRALSPKPADRFPSVLDFIAVLESPGRMTLPDARPTGRASSQILTIPDWQPPPRERISARTVLILAAVVGMAAAAWNWGPGLVNRYRHPLYDDGAPRPAARQPAAPAAATADSTAAAPGAPAPSARAGRTDRGTQTPVAARPPAPSPTRPPAARRTTAAQAPSRVVPRPTPPPAPVAAAETGRLSVNATPWGQLYVDGQLVGNTPKINLTVNAGTHTIRVARDGFDPVERSVTVGAGQSVRVTDIVLTEHQP